MFKLDEEAYTVGSLRKILESIKLDASLLCTRKGRVPTDYYNIACSFDIETTSFYTHKNHSFDYQQAQVKCKELGHNLTKYACMYIWQLGINGHVVVGRTWDEFIAACRLIVDSLGLEASDPENHIKGRHLIIYVHNLGFEFQFIKELFSWSTVFSRSTRAPIYAVTTDGIEFRCSYMLTNSSLASVGKHLTKYKVSKMVGDLDYSLLRNSETNLTDKEIRYCINDVLVVMAHIQAEIERLGDITKLPLTNTGYTRQYCRERCLYLWDWEHDDYLRDDKGHKQRNFQYINKIKKLIITNPLEFKALKSAFFGGHTHASISNCYKVHGDVSSYDFTSSYPTVMVSEVYPCSSSYKHYSYLPRKDFIKLISARNYVDPVSKNFLYKSDKDLKRDGTFTVRRVLAIATFIFKNISLKYDAPDSIIPLDKCSGFDPNKMSEVVRDNGKLVAAPLIQITATSIDFELYTRFYDFDDVHISDVFVYRASYLPTEYVRCVLELYKSKTKLKGLAGKEDDYQRIKARLNSLYGMCVTNPDTDDICFTNEYGWSIAEHTDELTLQNLNSYNESRSRFLFYPWGVFITAYARYNLMLGISSVGRHDFIYSDTDSMKIRNRLGHNTFIAAYNKVIINRLKIACMFHQIPYEDISDFIEPLNQKGVKKPLGIWDFEGDYTYFKTVGAKRYMTFVKDDSPEGGSLSLTVAGLDKKVAVPFLINKYQGDLNEIFKSFEDGMYVPPEGVHKLMSTYIDHAAATPVNLTDYQGNTVQVHEKSFLHLEPASFTMSLLPEYLYLIENHHDILYFTKHPQERL